MTVAEVKLQLEKLSIDQPVDLTVDELHALFFAMAVLNSLTESQVILIDNLLSLERTAPRP